LRGMPLLPRPTLILQQDPLDDPGERVELRTRRRPASPVPGRYRKRQHLRNRPRIDAKTPRCFPPAHTFNLNRITNLSIELHALHPPAPATVRQRLSAAGFLLRRNRTARPLHEGSFLRRLQLKHNLRFTRDVEDVGVLATLGDEDNGLGVPAGSQLRAATGPAYGRIWDADI